jgi:membrane protein required for colicin V production
MVFTGVDVGVAVLVLISAVLATARGFTREILSLATWAGSAAVAAYMYFNHKDLAEHYIDNPLIATGVTIVGSFLISLVILHLLTMWIGDMVVDSRVGPLDRTLGFVFGAARGVLICIVAAVFASYLLGTNSDKTPPMLKDAKSYPPLLSAGDWLIGLLPPDIEAQVNGFLHKSDQNPNDTGPNDTTTTDTTGGDTTPPADISSSASSSPGA